MRYHPSSDVHRISASDAPASMIALFCAVLAAPLLAAAVALSPPMGARAALLADIQPRGSVLHARQMLYPQSCFSLCDPILATLNGPGCHTIRACGCTPQGLAAVRACISCATTADPFPGNVANGQELFYNYTYNCAQDGHPVSGNPPPAQPQPNNPSPRPTTANGNPPTVNSPPAGVPDDPNTPSMSLGGGPTVNAPPLGATTTSSSRTSTTSRPTNAAQSTSALETSILPTGFQSNSVPAAGVMGVGVSVQVICAIFSLLVTVMLLA